VPTDGERLATLEQQMRDFGKDVSELTAEMGRARGRLHDLEGIVGTFVSVQQENRRQEKLQYQKLGNRIGIGGLAMSFGLLVLAGVTIWLHVG
jgi:hypothetical protein